jgi:hypothetical protein
MLDINGNHIGKLTKLENIYSTSINSKNRKDGNIAINLMNKVVIYWANEDIYQKKSIYFLYYDHISDIKNNINYKPLPILENTNINIGYDMPKISVNRFSSQGRNALCVRVINTSTSTNKNNISCSEFMFSSIERNLHMIYEAENIDSYDICNIYNDFFFLVFSQSFNDQYKIKGIIIKIDNNGVISTKYELFLLENATNEKIKDAKCAKIQRNNKFIYTYKKEYADKDLIFYEIFLFSNELLEMPTKDISMHIIDIDISYRYNNIFPFALDSGDFIISFEQFNIINNTNNNDSDIKYHIFDSYGKFKINRRYNLNTNKFRNQKDANFIELRDKNIVFATYTSDEYKENENENENENTGIFYEKLFNCGNMEFVDSNMDYVCNKCSINCKYCSDKFDKCECPTYPEIKVPVEISSNNILCLNKSPSGYFLNQLLKYYQKCDISCITCSSLKLCNSCNTSYYYFPVEDISGKCLNFEEYKNNKEYESYYFNKLNSKFMKCDISCLNCNQPSSISSNCISCNNEKGYFKLKKNYGLFDCKDRNSVKGFYVDLSLKEFLKCENFCAECFAIDKCTSCVNGYYISKNENKCYNNLNKPLDYYIEGNEILKCQEKCKECIEKDKCVKCNNQLGFYLRENKEKECFNFSTLVKEEINSKLYLEEVNGEFIIKNCDKKCGSCEKEFDNCITCNIKEGYYEIKEIQKEKKISKNFL